MKHLLLRHYELIKRRGLITPETTIHHFIDKIEEEFYEVRNAYADDYAQSIEPSDRFWHEGMDLIMTIANAMQHYGVDFEEELKKNIKIQEGRI